MSYAECLRDVVQRAGTVKELEMKWVDIPRCEGISIGDWPLEL
jgi:hypothetical protein